MKNLFFQICGAALLILVVVSCSKAGKEPQEYVFSPASLVIDNSIIPIDSIKSDESGVEIINGVVYRNKLNFSGYVITSSVDSKAYKVEGFLNGMQHGRSVEYYPGGALKTLRMYKENKSYGKHIGYWENGNQKFEFYYNGDKREGPNKQWYESGAPYAFLNYKDDREEGLQQAWRENGKVYINYEVKDGYRYGLQKSALCYTLKDEKLKKAD